MNLHAHIFDCLLTSLACLNSSSLYAYIDTDPSGVIFLSFDDELVFDQNQRSPEEYHEQIRCQFTPDHLPHALDETFEGKRCPSFDTFFSPTSSRYRST